MKLKRFVCLALSFSMFLSILLTGCSGEQEKKEVAQQGLDDRIVETDEYKYLDAQDGERTLNGWKYEPMVTVTSFRIKGTNIKFKKGEDCEHNVWADAYREKLGIDLKNLFVVPSSDVYDTKVNQALSIDQLPDIMPLYTTLFFKIADAHKLCDLQGVYDAYASPTVKYWYEEINDIVPATCNRDGKMAAISAGGIPSGSFLWIRKDWLRNVGMEWPKNLNETFDVMEAFAHKDPDKNGKNDTYGIAVAAGPSGIEVIGDCMGAHTGWVGINNEEDIAYGLIQPEWKPVLQKLHELYVDKVIDPEFIQKSTDMINQDYSAQRLGLTYTGKSGPDGSLNKAVEANANCDWGHEVATDAEGNPVQVTCSTRVVNFSCASYKTEYAAALILLINCWEPFIMGEEAENQKFHDFVDTDGTRYDSFFYPAFGFGGSLEYDFICQEKVSKALEKGDPSGLNGEQNGYYERSMPWYKNKDPQGWRMCGIYGPGGSIETMKEMYDQNLFYLSRDWCAEPPSWVQYGPNLSSKHGEYFSKIIIGEYSVDEGFQKWIDVFNSSGGKEVTEDYNKWWDSEGRAGMESIGKIKGN